MTERHPAVEQILQWFEYEHLPPHLQKVSKPMAEMAYRMADDLASSPELVAGLRKLLEAKDCFVRQAVADHKAGANT